MMAFERRRLILRFVNRRNEARNLRTGEGADFLRRILDKNRLESAGSVDDRRRLRVKRGLAGHR